MKKKQEVPTLERCRTTYMVLHGEHTGLYLVDDFGSACPVTRDLLQQRALFFPVQLKESA